MSQMLFHAASAHDASARSPAPFASEENLNFISLQDSKGAFLHRKFLIGTLERPDTVSGNLHFIDLYKMDETNKIVVDKELCREGAIHVLGTLESPWVEGHSDTFESRYGHACELSVGEIDPETDIKEQRFIVAFVHGTPYIFRANFAKLPTPTEIKELHTFIKGLRNLDTAAKSPAKKSNRAPASL